MCNHFNCKKHHSNGRRKGVGVAYIVKYYANGKFVGNFMAAVLERGGKYKGTFSVPGGKLEGSDCWIGSAIREFKEEVKHDLGPNFDAEFRGPDSHVRWVFVKGTPLLVGQAPRGFSRGPLNKRIAAANADPSLPWCERETDEVEFVALVNGQVCNPQGAVLPASDYLRDALKELYAHWGALSL